MIKYVTCYDIGISKIEVKGETEKQVILKNGRRESKTSEHGNNYFGTFDGAKKFLLDRELKEIKRLKRFIFVCESNISLIEDIKLVE